MAILQGSDPNGHDSSLNSPLLPNPSKEPGWESGPGSRPRPQKLCIDDMLTQYCGEFGFWQLRHFILTSLAWALEAFHTMVMIFADQEPGWRCIKGSGCEEEKQISSVCGLEPGSWEWNNGLGSSTVAQWGLVCSDKYKVGLVQALFFTGCMIGKLFNFHLIFSLLVLFLLVYLLDNIIFPHRFDDEFIYFNTFKV